MEHSASADDLLRRLETTLHSGRRDEELRLRGLLATHARDADIQLRVGELYWRAGRVEEAGRILTAATGQFPDNHRVWLTFAVFQCRQDRFAESLRAYEHAIELAPHDGMTRHRYGWALSAAGRTGAALAQLHKAIELEPANAAAHYLLATLKHYRADDPHLRQLRDVLREPLEPRQRSRLLFALGRALEQTGQNGDAFACYHEANQLRRTEFDFDIGQEQQYVEWLIENFDASLVSRTAPGFANATPVFIVGMPRSGAALIEHMLTAHPDIAGVGETALLPQTLESGLGGPLMPDATLPGSLPAGSTDVWHTIGKQYVAGLRQLAGFKERIVDKQLFNYYLLGVIALALPDARIVHCTRDPMDTCIACFTTTFSQGRPWLYSLDEFSQAWSLYRRLMTHWHSLMPGRIVEVSYEDLIDDPEARLRALLTTLGVDWSDRCLGFSDGESLATATGRGTVNRPVYPDPVGRWRRFETQLAAVRQRL